MPVLLFFLACLGIGITLFILPFLPFLVNIGGFPCPVNVVAGGAIDPLVEVGAPAVAHGEGVGIALAGVADKKFFHFLKNQKQKKSLRLCIFSAFLYKIPRLRISRIRFLTFTVDFCRVKISLK
jgi:hypothetical protein